MLRRRRLGSSEIEVGLLGLGGNVFGPPRLDLGRSRAVLDAASELGVDFVDTADVYAGGQSEEILGELLTGRRDRWVVATKFNLRDLGDRGLAAHVRSRLEASLRRLRSDHVDLYQVHLAPPDSVDPLELLAVLDSLVRAGVVRAVGVCNAASWRLAVYDGLAREHGLVRISTVQNYWHLLARGVESEVVPYAARAGIGVLPYHPLGGGYLTGKYQPGAARPAGTRGAAGSPIIDTLDTPAVHARVQELASLAAAHGRTVGELAIAYLASQPVVTSVIAGASTPAQLSLNAAGASWELDAELLASIDACVAAPPNPEVLPYAGTAPTSTR
ncbi:MAG: aldo/keto reductase [Candidatus Nanopelagicales bacterium]